MKFNPKGLIVTGAGLLIFVVALETRTAAAVDAALLLLLGVILALSSVAIVAARVAGRAAIGQVGAFQELRRWLSNDRSSYFDSM